MPTFNHKAKHGATLFAAWRATTIPKQVQSMVFTAEDQSHLQMTQISQIKQQKSAQSLLFCNGQRDDAT
jgi:hypothetical protein